MSQRFIMMICGAQLGATVPHTRGSLCVAEDIRSTGILPVFGGPREARSVKRQRAFPETNDSLVLLK
ncbi:hypothetical protein LMG28727_06909 [Paraburkholderia kirstenboschensis]|nr:hypothetical protein LMG28727_06909 [Paraburkholderia kirstenboschensis]